MATGIVINIAQNGSSASDRWGEKSSFAVDFDIMSDDPWIMRQDALTPPLCPSAALKFCFILSVLIHCLSAAACFGYVDSDKMGV